MKSPRTFGPSPCRHSASRSAAAIELRAIDPAEAANYLERVQLDPPPDGWRDLIDHIRINKASALSKALDNPLTLTLVRDTYQSGDDARELLEFCGASPHGIPGHPTAEDITDHLLDRVLPAAYAHRPGQPVPPYDLATAHNALAKIATRMNHERTQDLQWWRIPMWASPIQRVVIGALVGGLADGLEFGLLSVLWGTVGIGILSLGGNTSQRLGRLRLRKALTMTNLIIGFGLAFLAMLVFGLGLGLVTGLVNQLVVGLALVLLVGFMIGLQDAFADPDSAISLSPATSQRDDRRYGVAMGLGLGLVIGLVIGLPFGLTFGLVVGFVMGLLLALTIPRTWPVSLTAAQLAIKWHTPVHLVRFLDDAHKRNVLRNVGPVYQFRHARLQDRLVTKLDG